MTLRSLLAQVSSIAIAVLFAVIVWVVATNEQNPTREALFQDAVPIAYSNQAAGLTLLDKSADAVHVRLRAPESSWQNLTAANFQAVADMSHVARGNNQIPVGVKIIPADPRVKIISVDPPTVTVHLEEIKQVPIEVRVRVLDEPALGYEIKSPVVTPLTVTITGPRGDIEQVNDATVEVALRGAKSPIQRDAAVVLHDAQGKQIQDLKIEPATVAVQVPVEQRVGYKDVAVKASIRGTVPSGYWVSDINVDPATLTLVGAPEALDKVEGFVEAEPVTVTGARSDVSKRVELTLPAGVSLLAPTDIIVRVSVEPVLGGLTLQRNVTLSDVGCSLISTVAPDSVQVILSGPLPILQALKPDDVQIVADLARCAPGTYQSDLRAVNVPDALKVESIVPNSAEINLKEK